MTFDEFRLSVKRGAKPPHGLSAPLRALWLERKGDWAAYGQEQKRIEEALRSLREGR